MDWDRLNIIHSTWKNFGTAGGKWNEQRPE